VSNTPHAHGQWQHREQDTTGTGRRGKREVREEKEEAGTSRDQRRPGVEAGFDMPFVEQTCNVLPRDNSNGTKAV
jgi:hypothetical protein